MIVSTKDETTANGFYGR